MAAAGTTGHNPQVDRDHSRKKAGGHSGSAVAEAGAVSRRQLAAAGRH